MQRPRKHFGTRSSSCESLPEKRFFLCLAEQHLADLYSAQKQYADAESEHIHSLQTAEASRRPNDGLVDGAVERLGLFYKNWGKYDQAVPYYVRSVKIMEARSDSISASRLTNYLATLSDLMRRINRPDEAQQYEDRRKHLIDLQSSKTSTQPRSSGRVRQVGPPAPLTQISDPGKVCTSNPASRRRRLVLRFSSSATRRLFPRDITLHASVSRSEASISMNV